uniref:RRM domain-containing protein n=1 Tax=Romanomermis culicivorax TaxID=13658 RepID=A0A915KVT8_ROMCU
MTNRESRHLKINGLSENSTEESILNYFANFGKVQKIEFLNDEKSAAVVSFMDLRSAANAVSRDRHDLKSQTAPLKVCYFESMTSAVAVDNSDNNSSDKQSQQQHPQRKPVNHKG